MMKLSDPSDPRSEAARRQSAIQTLIGQRDQALDDLEALRAEVARVRADVAEEIAKAIDRERDRASTGYPGAPHYIGALRRAAGIAEEHAVAPAESVVGAPTPISAPSDVAAPRDALTDQDFEGFNEAIKRARGPELFAQEGQPTCDAPHPLGGPACQRGGGHDYQLRRVSGGSEGWVALPEDEGTRQEGLSNVEQ
jgi:hypothetical protein